MHRRHHHRHSVYRIRIDDSFPIDVYSDPSLSGAERRKTAEMYVETLNHGFGECTRRRLADFLAELNSGCGPIRISRAAPQSLLRSSASFSNRMMAPLIVDHQYRCVPDPLCEPQAYGFRSHRVSLVAQ
ncbi:MAG TPA: hypothetical protein VGY58_22635, partial [Gemmataceae bacterium]|nr:hypothetical protein [Gemmataceae bacterium]